MVEQESTGETGTSFLHENIAVLSLKISINTKDNAKKLRCMKRLFVRQENWDESSQLIRPLRLLERERRKRGR